MSADPDTIESIWSELNLQDLLKDKVNNSDDDASYGSKRQIKSSMKDGSNSNSNHNSPIIGKKAEYKDSNRKTTRETSSQLLDDDDISYSKKLKDETKSNRKSHLERLSDPLRGRYANFDDLIADDVNKKIARNNRQLRVSNSNSSSNSPKVIKKSIRSPTLIPKDLGDYNDSDPSLSPGSSMRLSPHFEKQFNSNKNHNFSIKSDNDLKRSNTDNKGFFLTEAIDYDDEGFEEDDSAVVTKQREALADNKNIGFQKEKSTDGTEKTKVSISPSKAKIKILQTYEQNPIFDSDHVLSRVSKRLEEATKLETLIQENISKEELKKSAIKDKKYDDYKIKPNKYGPVQKGLNDQKHLMKSKPISKPQNLLPRKKAWEDPLLKSNVKSKRIINKGVLSSHTAEKPQKNSFISRFTKNNKLLSKNDKKINNVDLKNPPWKSNDLVNGNEGKRDTKFNLSHSNKKDKKDVFLSQLDGRSRTNLKDQNNSSNSNKIRISNTNGNPRKQTDSHFLPLINEKKKIQKTSNTSYNTKSENKPQNDNTFITNLDFSSTKSKDFKNDKLIGKRTVRPELVKKRMQSRSAPNLNHLERVDNVNERKDGIKDLTKERRNRGDRKINIAGSDNIIVGKREGRTMRSNSIDLEKKGITELIDRRIDRKSDNEDDRNGRFPRGIKKSNSTVSFDVRERTSLTNPTTNNIGNKNDSKSKSGSYGQEYKNANNDIEYSQLNPINKKEMKKNAIVNYRKTSDIIDLLGQVEIKEYDRFKESKGDLKEGRCDIDAFMTVSLLLFIIFVCVKCFFPH